MPTKPAFTQAAASTVVSSPDVAWPATGSASLLDGAKNAQIGGVDEGDENVIFSNLQDGVRMAGGAEENRLWGNLVGTDLYATRTLSNRGSGIAIVDSPNNLVGIESGTKNEAQRNLISGNRTNDI